MGKPDPRINPHPGDELRGVVLSKCTVVSVHRGKRTTTVTFRAAGRTYVLSLTAWRIWAADATVIRAHRRTGPMISRGVRRPSGPEIGSAALARSGGSLGQGIVI